MKKLLILALMAAFLLNATACSKKNTGEIVKFQNDLNIILTEISNIHENINAVDVNSENASKTILSNLSDLQDAFDDLSNLNITDKKHSYITDLAKEGSDYMSQAYDLFKAAYKENTFDADSADLAYQYLERASKRIRVIVTMLHGDVPDDVIIHE